MANCPTEITTTEILPRLPAESLLRFKCVSKSFKSLISSPQFIDLHLRQSLSSDANRRLMIVDRGELYSVDVDSPESSTAVKVPFPGTLDYFLCGDVSIIGSHNGLLCIEFRIDHAIGDYRHLLINPFTGIYREIPYNCVFGSWKGHFVKICFGFGFDDINDDYKLVKITENATSYDFYEGDDNINREVMVCSLKTNEWRIADDLNSPWDSIREGNGALINSHLLHWAFSDPEEFRIGCFDVRTEKWTIDVPLMELDYPHRLADFEDDGTENEVVVAVDIGVLDGCLCLLIHTRVVSVVWIMKEYRVKESWVKLFEMSSCCSCACVDKPICSTPVCYRKGSKDEVLVRLRAFGNSKLVWFNIQSKRENGVEIDGLANVSDVCMFKDSLVDIPGGQQLIKVANQLEDDDIMESD